MKLKQFIPYLFSMSLFLTQLVCANENLVTIGKYQVTADELQSTVASSPIAVQFNTMDEKDQASVRGDLLKRLVASKLLRLEAESQQLEKTETFKKDVKDFKLGLLYRFYMDKLRKNIQLSEQDLQQLRLETNGNQDEFLSAKSAYASEIYRGLRKYTVQKLSKEYHVKFYLDKINPSVTANTVLMSGDNNLQIIYSDIINKSDYPQMPTFEYIEDRLYKQAELLLIAKVAEKENVDISRRLENYKIEQLTALLMNKMEKQWVPDEKTLRNYFIKHPEIAIIPERRNIGMIILDTKETAEVMKKRISQGESLFKLASQYSIDPYGRANSGDYGWIKEGTGTPEIEEIIKDLKNKQVSNIIKTAKGYHIVVILDRRTGATRHYAGIKDKIHQQIVDQKMGLYLQELQNKYQVVWHVIKPASVPKSSQKTSQNKGNS